MEISIARSKSGGQGETPDLIMVGWLSNALDVANYVGVDSLASDDTVLHGAYQELGNSALTICHGSYVAIVIHDSKVILLASSAPGPPLYWAWSADKQALWFATECADFPSDLRSLRHPSEVSEVYMRKYPAATPFGYISRVVAGTLVECDARNGEVRRRNYFNWTRGAAQRHARAEQVVRDELRCWITAAIAGPRERPAYCLVSGGVDSSIIATLAAGKREHIDLVSVGTEQANEFEAARRVGELLGKTVREITLPGEAYEQHYPALVLALEHPFSTYAEYLLPLWIALREGQFESGADILTGYGADVLFGGFARANSGVREISQLVRSEYQSTLYSNEFSQALSPTPDTRVMSPFFDSGVVKLALSIDPALKHDGSVEKAILRRAFETDLGGELAWRPKLGVHTSTGSEGWLTGRACVSGTSASAAREFKDKVSYEILRAGFEEGLRSDEILMDEVITACR
ncbi:MAG TPA: asparagine synthase C-terminal domain-containing protein [Solirubrobacteraceae bacterium]|nr:asparagine synthase C-terminal domain-containing protein [Solirubrobacteraceae bacterium]